MKKKYPYEKTDDKAPEDSVSKPLYPEQGPDKELPEGFGVENISEAIVRFDNNRRHTSLSGNLFTFLHVEPRHVLGKTLTEAGYLKDLSEEIDHNVGQVMVNGKQFYKESYFFFDNKLFWLSISLLPEKNTHGETISVTGIFRDISKQKNFEKKYKEKKQWYKLAAEASDNGIWDWEVGSEEMHLSRKWKSQLGYDHDELENAFATWVDLLHQDDYNRVKHSFEKFLKSSSLVFKSEFRLKHKDGLYRWFKCRAVAVRDTKGKAIRVLGAHHDITTEKKSQDDLRMFHQAIMQSPVPFVITDTDGYIELFNPAFSKITGYTKDELVGKKTNVQKSGYHTQSFYKTLWETILSGSEWRGEFKNRNKKGHHYWELASISSLKNEQGEITHYLKISEEISSIKKMEDDLRKSNKRAQLENQTRNSFIANMSHEIRTPINGIIGFSELLKSGNLTEDQQNRYVDIIEESSRDLLILIDDMIDISKIEANELKLKKDACSLRALLQDLSEEFGQMKIQKKKVQLEIRFRSPQLKHHDYIFTDQKRLRQMLYNLFDNALKFTDTGYIEIGYQLLSKNKLQFYVEDSGQGIPKNQLKNIFTRTAFHAHSIKDKDGGAGLGLAICHGLAKLMGGDINVKSIPNKGSIFYFTIPYDKISSPPKESKRSVLSDYDFKDFTILIAEDVDYNFEYLKEILRETNATILWAKDGIDALNLYSKHKVDIILMDIQLPEIDGYEATRTIRESNQDIPIIAQTAYAMSDDHQKCYSAGCNEVLTKPIKMKEMLETLARYLKPEEK
jgi:PAS domain S-box-containing protein